MSDEDDPTSDGRAPIRIRNINRLSFNDNNLKFQIVSIYFTTHKPMVPGQQVRIEYGFDKYGNPRVLVGTPRRRRTLHVKVDTVVHLYVLEMRVPYVD